MQAHKALKALLLTFILSTASFLPVLLIPSVKAEDSQGVTTLYFTDIMGENTSDLIEFSTLSENPPLNQNDSQYPPHLFIKNTSSWRPKLEQNFEKWAAWFATWSFLFIEDIPEMDEIPGFNLSDLFGGYELLLPNPLRISEMYTYEGNDSVSINGDITFNLFFEQPTFKILNRLPSHQDSVKVGIYTVNSYFLPTLIKNINVTLKPTGLASIYKQQITIENVVHTVKPGENLLFTIELLPGNRTLGNIITNRLDIQKRIDILLKRANFLENRSRLPKIQYIGTFLKEMLTVVEDIGVNITSKDIANIYNSIVSSKLVYASAGHPSSVTIPAKIIEEDIREYFLGPNQAMSQSTPTNTSVSKSTLSTSLTWTSTPVLERNKILKLSDVTAYLYFYRPFSLYIGKFSIIATLYDDNITLATSEKQLTKQELNTLLSKSKNPIVFTFSGVDAEISNGHSLRLSVSLGNASRFPLLKLLSLQYNSIASPSSLRVKFQETNNIHIHDINTTASDGNIIPGGSALYLINISSKKADTLQISTTEREKTGTWQVSSPKSATVSANNWVTIPLFINSTDNTKEAYGNTIDLVVVVSGKTGIARQSISSQVSTDAIHYKVEILQHAPSINISRGEKHFYYFIIKNNNTGAIDDIDSYTITATSRNDWPLIPQESIRNLLIGDSTDADDAKVLIEVPKNTTLTSDVVTITVTSDGNSDASASITITVNVIGGGVIEDILDFFDSAARSLGLYDMFGSDAKFVLMILLVVIILFLIIILALLITTKSVRIICTDRIKEIELSEKASFDVTIQNLSRKPQSFEIQAQPKTPSSKWVTTVEPPVITIDGKQSLSVQIIITPTEDAVSKDWTEVTVSVKKVGKKKTESITLLTLTKEGKTLLHLRNVSHWPTIFNPGERVITSCSLSNNGTISARNIKVFFYLNGKQKNKLEVTIPPQNIADIQIPWIAVKGKNQVRIRVKEE